MAPGSLVRSIAPLLFVPLLRAGELPRKDFPNDSSPGGQYSLAVVPPGAPSPGGPYVLVLHNKSSGAERELLRFRVHVDALWSRKAEQLAVSDFGDGHRGNAYLFDLRRSSSEKPIDIGARLLAERPETAPLFQQEGVIVEVQYSWEDLAWTVFLHGRGTEQPRGFHRWYQFDLERGFRDIGRGPKSLGNGEKDYDGSEAKAWKKVLQSGQEAGLRVYALKKLMYHDAHQGLTVLGDLLDDADAAVRDAAAEWLAIRGDRRGLDVMRAWLDDPRRAPLAARRLGNAGKPEYAAAVASRIRAILAPWWRRPWDASSRAFLRSGTIALARLGRREDRELIFEVLRVDDSARHYELEALGFVEDPRSQQILRTALERLSKVPGSARERVNALLALSRHGDVDAIGRVKEILRNREGWWPPNLLPIPAAERAAAFDSLRARDAIHFAETVFEVAGQDPEGPGTLEAWEALGVMHPAGYGRRVVKLAWSRRPHWKTVTQDRLNDVVIAIDPDLNSVFWTGYDAERVPAMTGKKTLVREGLGAIMFKGSWDWIGE